MPSLAVEPTQSPWRREPFRVFFPVGVVLGWIAIGHWLLYSTGITSTYSCMLHGLIQTQAFLMAFAMGFLLTALPRRTQAPPPSAAELWVAGAALLATTGAAAMEAWTIAEVGYVTQLLLLLRFAVRRFLARTSGRRPPAAFVLIPFAFLHGLGGAGLLLAWSAFGAPTWTIALGRLLVEQGVFLCLVVGIGGLILPLMAGAPPPPDLGSSPRERAKALAYGAAGVLVFASLLIEHAGWVRIGPLLRATVVAAGLALGGGAWRLPSRPGLHRRLVWIAVWLVPTGLALSGLLPDYRVPALHVLFIGGFSLLAFGVATHVSVSHLDMEAARDGSPAAIRIVAAGILLAMLGRVAADWSATYFAHLGAAAAAWLVASVAWLAFLGPKLVRPNRMRYPMVDDDGPGPISRLLAADHARLDALLARAAEDPVAYGEFRRGLLRHIGMEEKILLPAAQRARDGTPLPAAARLRLDHGALAALLVPSPTPTILRAVHGILTRHNALEEGPDGIYAAGERLMADDGGSLVAALAGAPQPKVSPNTDGEFVMNATRHALERAGYSLEDFAS